ncbi:MAG TPA: acylphosphatase [Gemmatimonadaceae bacterium]
MRTIHVEISGRVQGVGFRWFARESARALKLRGWVKNRPDGAVEIAAGGDAPAIRHFRAALEKGPDGARVERVRELDPVDEAALGAPFTIVR